jgi:hypothetical protein
MRALLTAIQRLAKRGKIGMSRPSSAALGVLMPILALLASAAHLP